MKKIVTCIDFWIFYKIILISQIYNNLAKFSSIIESPLNLVNFAFAFTLCPRLTRAAASRFSISNSANNGGEVGWIKETLLSENLNSILKKINKNEITEPIKYPTGYLILRINDKKELKQKINIEKELNELVMYEKNRQLNQFSLLLFKKLKQNIQINEY